MKPPCEIVVSKIIPQIRAAIVNALIAEYKLRQSEISERLGITQAAISQYLSSTRGRDKTVLKLFPEVQKDTRKIAKSIAMGKAKSANIISLMCKSCKALRKNPKFCEYHKSFTQLDECKICYKPGR